MNAQFLSIIPGFLDNWNSAHIHNLLSYIQFDQVIDFALKGTNQVVPVLASQFSKMA